MPKIQDIKEVKRKFKKSNYRPWNFLEELEKESIQANSSLENKIEHFKDNESNSFITTWQHTDEKIEQETTINEEKHKKKPNTNYTQTTHEPSTNYTQTIHKNTQPPQNSTQTIHTTQHTTQHKHNTNITQTIHKEFNLRTKESFSSFTGLQRKILVFIYQSCKVSRSRETQELTIQYIINTLNIKAGSIKTSIKRLEKKEAIKQTKFKNGRGGWVKYELQEHIYRDLMLLETEHKHDTNMTQTIHKPYTQPYTQPYTSPLSGSSYINTTSSESVDVQKNSAELPPQWEEIVTLPLSEIGFTKTHLFQIVKQDKLSPQMVQDSIYAFAFDLTHNNKIANIKGSALNYFMGVVRNGLPYAFPENYKSPHEEGMRVYLERKKASESRQAELDNEIINTAFKDWLATLTDEKINTIVPSAFRKMNNQSQAKQAALREYFKTEKWPTIKNELLCSENITVDNPS